MPVPLLGLDKPPAVIFSDDRRHRYVLERRWSTSGPAILFIGLNPSTADEVRNDPTVERCERRAKRLGAGGLYMGNLFSLRSTDPRLLKTSKEPTRDHDNIPWLMTMSQRAQIVVACWGASPIARKQADEVLPWLDTEGKLYCIRKTVKGAPWH